MRTRKFQLTDSERITLENGHKNHPKSHFRQRCHALLLCNAGWKIKDVAKLYNIRTRSIYAWMNRWRDIGVIGLTIIPGRGLKAKLSQLEEETVTLVKKKSIN